MRALIDSSHSKPLGAQLSSLHDRNIVLHNKVLLELRRSANRTKNGRANFIHNVHVMQPRAVHQAKIALLHHLKKRAAGKGDEEDPADFPAWSAHHPQK